MSFLGSECHLQIAGNAIILFFCWHLPVSSSIISVMKTLNEIGMVIILIWQTENMLQYILMQSINSALCYYLNKMYIWLLNFNNHPGFIDTSTTKAMIFPNGYENYTGVFRSNRDTKMLPFCRPNIETRFRDCKISHFYSYFTKTCSGQSNDSVLIDTMAWHRTKRVFTAHT